MSYLQILFTLGVMLLPSATLLAQRPTLKTDVAKKKVTEFDDAFRVLEGKHKEAGAHLDKLYDEEIEKIRTRLTDSLSTLLEKETKEGNLDQAIEIRDAIKFYKAFDPRKTPTTMSVAAISRENASLREQVKKLQAQLDSLQNADKWFVLFRSADPKIWNQESRASDDHFSKRISEAPRNLRYLKLSRMSGECVIIPMTFDGLGRANIGNQRYSWVGNNVDRFNANHLGIVDNTLPGQRGVQYIIVQDPDLEWRRGWGFGHVHLRNVQGWTWGGERIEKEVFEISVTPFELTKDEFSLLLK